MRVPSQSVIVAKHPQGQVRQARPMAKSQAVQAYASVQNTAPKEAPRPSPTARVTMVDNPSMHVKKALQAYMSHEPDVGEGLGGIDLQV